MKRWRSRSIVCPCCGQPIERITRSDRNGVARTYDICPTTHESLGIGSGVTRADYERGQARKRRTA